MVCKTLPLWSSKMPYDIWFKIMMVCGLEEVLCLEATCKYFFSLASSRLVWLERLQELDQDHAPDLAPHIPISSLTWYELRNTVLKARRRFLNCTGTSPPRATREVIVPIGTANVDDPLVKTLCWGMKIELLPGGRYLFVKWPVGHLQCWDVAASECIWTYPKVPQGPPEVQRWGVWRFAYDMQADGDVRVLVVSKLDDTNIDQRKLEVLRFSPPEKTLTSLFSCFPEVLEWHGLPMFARICGDVLATYTEGHLLVAFWEERHTIAIVDSILESMEIVDEYLICIRKHHEASSIVAIPLRFVHNLVKSDTSVSHVKLEDLPITECPIAPPAYWRINRATLSVCTFHWKAQKERNEISITVFADVYDDADLCGFPLALFFLFKKGGDSDGPDSHPSLVHQGLSKIPTSDQSKLYMVSPPSQAGSIIIASNNDFPHQRSFVTFMRDRSVVYKFLDADCLERRLAPCTLNTEFYSGATLFVVGDTRDAVIQYYD